MKALRVIISGGGTGGHIFPAIAIANALKKRDPNTAIHFVGAEGRMEMEKVPEAGYEIDGLWISGLQRKLDRRNLSFPFKVLSSLIKSRKIIRKFKPDICIGVGGYASGPLLYAASRMGVPTLIQEQNSFPGITNRILASRVNRICVAYEGLERWFPKEKIVMTGNPIRSDVIEIIGKRESANTHFDLDPSKKTILFVGGSLGARSINESVRKHYKEILAAGYQILWQHGKAYSESAEALSKGLSSKEAIKLHVFIKKMDLAYAAADFIVSRAGAMAVSELCHIDKPTFLVPSPNVAEDHQTKNAMALVNRGAARLIKDAEVRETLWEELEAVLNDEQAQASLKRAIALMAQKDSDERIADEIIEITKR
uniref:UDP-N-acetylglucosamine--N-acetylmuramyl-(pentapeptide) pyrophosphoryl-undecaprenol N-acetylglucosamine transferase n=1 Tax=uncultured Flavobacteriia bacterium TaxID=212695 RepID=H6RFV8_9BACT|nr:UDP-N-acetylglucosamine--N-acetylmuramyl-(pentap eptide) pyrophosphoryl-undecaprenol N-acetylglucosaminetransferase, glycosyl transferase family GT28 [uncultured bacterium]CCF99919.1 UDP-N-acetylglucosamine--N-acetylmuramyl-(pentapeptide) pyrophosphoryl-undecaprenol N-acetylglucosamine transferase [uncultured Flavobacteriia bacterium]